MEAQKSAVLRVLDLMDARDHVERVAMDGREAPATILYYGNGGGAGFGPEYFGLSPRPTGVGV